MPVDDPRCDQRSDVGDAESSDTSPKSKGTTELALLIDANAFDRHAFVATFSAKANMNTRKAYWADYRVYRTFYLERGFDPSDPPEDVGTFFVEWLKQHREAPKTRVRRVSALSRIYRQLCRPRRKGVEPYATWNPFSTDLGPEREKALPIRPTRLADCKLVRRVLSSCGATDLGIRDAAIVRTLWKTGMRRCSLLSMTFERLARERDPAIVGDFFVATVIGKGGSDARVLIVGKAADALDQWLKVLAKWNVDAGPIWRRPSKQPMTERDVGRMFGRRLLSIGAKAGSLTPHQLRVSFATRNPAPLEEKQEALGHADPATTRLYDRSAWRGRAAFTAMPELEDVE